MQGATNEERNQKRNTSHHGCLLVGWLVVPATTEANYYYLTEAIKTTSPPNTVNLARAKLGNVM
jgi:hypothetical protein